MNFKHNCTKGPATYKKREVGIFCDVYSTDPGKGGFPSIARTEDEANAQLIAEAFNVLAETGMTPRELAERIHEYRELLETARITLYAAEHQLPGNVEHFYTNRLKNRRDLQRDNTGKLNPLTP